MDGYQSCCKHQSPLNNETKPQIWESIAEERTKAHAERLSMSMMSRRLGKEPKARKFALHWQRTGVLTAEYLQQKPRGVHVENALVLLPL